jgi:hypothetical protein
MKKVMVMMLMLGFTVFADSVSFIWTTNSEPDLAGYKLYYGTNSGRYSNIVNVPKTNIFQLQGLVRQKRYYFALTAYSTGGLESFRTPELTCVLPDPVSKPAKPAVKRP